MENQKTKGQLLEEEILYKGADGAETFTEEEYQKAVEFSEKYKQFLSSAKTDRKSTRLNSSHR